LNAEAAPAYGRAVLEWLSLCSGVAAAAGQPLVRSFQNRLVRSAETLAVLTDSGGHLVCFGDDDGEAVLTSALPESERLGAVLELAGLGAEGRATAMTAGIRTLGDGGYTVARHADPAGETHLVIDHATLGYGHIAAHAHADTLSLWVSVAGRPFVVEAGTYLYHGAGPWRQYFRSTAAHNTLTVEGRDSSRMSGPFNWRPGARATGRLIQFAKDDDTWSATASHDGYERDLHALHLRQVERLGPGRYQVTDRLAGPMRHRVQWSLLLAPDLDVEQNPNGWTCQRGGQPVAEIIVRGANRLSCQRGADSPRYGWYSPSFGQLEPTWQLLAEAELGEGSELVVELGFGAAGGDNASKPTMRDS
jgi:hypothetical protein